MRYTQTRAGDTLALGIFENKTLTIPVPGAPEVLQRGGPYGMNGCGCGGACGGMGSVPVLSAVSTALQPVFGDKSDYATFGLLGLGAYFLAKKLRKRR